MNQQLPTVGRIVHYRESGEEPCAALVVHVWSPTMVNLCVFSHNGLPTSKTSVYFAYEGEAPAGAFAGPL